MNNVYSSPAAVVNPIYPGLNVHGRNAEGIISTLVRNSTLATFSKTRLFSGGS